MPDYTYIVFDLDGTLTDPTEEMLASASYALKHFGIEQVPREKLLTVTQIPLLHCFEEQFGLSRKDADQAFIHYWYYASTFGVKLNEPYDGIHDLLVELQRRRKKLFIATARKTRNAEQILRAGKMAGYFQHVLGASEDETRRTKKLILFDLLAEFPEHEEHTVVMIGDRAADITAAHDNAVDSIGVTYGQEPPEEVRKASPTHLADNVQQLAQLLLGS